MYGLPNIVSILVWIAASLVVTGGARHVMSMAVATVLAALLVLLGFAPRVANQWQRAVVLRLGKFAGIRGPGLFFLVPFIDWITVMIDTRVLTTSFKAEQTLTRDTVPVNVDGVLFWQVVDPERA